MAVSAAAVHKSPGRFDTSWDVTATADADTGTTITHGIPNITDANDELKVTFEPLLQAQAAISAWAVTARSPADVTIAKGTDVGSGSLSAQVRVRIERRHGING